MNDILIPFTIGNEQKHLRITFPYGSSGIGHIYIDSYFQGQISKGEVWLNGNSVLTPEDVEVIKETVRKTPHTQ